MRRRRTIARRSGPGSGLGGSGSSPRAPKARSIWAASRRDDAGERHTTGLGAIVLILAVIVAWDPFGPYAFS